MSGILIVNMHVEIAGPGHRIDRTTVLGNPFKMVNNTNAERDRVCDLYHRWLWGEFKKKGPVYSVLNEFANEFMATHSLILKCWCAPQRCHGESIRAAVLWMVGQ